MGLERRGNNVFYYEKVRIGSKVISRYCGSGQIALLMHQARQEACRKTRREREMLRAEIQKERELDQIIDEFCSEAAAFETALHLANGYRRQFRQWRRIGNGTNKETE